MNLLRPDQIARGKIMVRTPNWIGDAVFCLPALRELRQALPEAELVLVARPWVLDVFPTEELRCRVAAYDTRGKHRGIVGRWRIASQLRRENFAAAILFQNAFDAALLAVLAGIPLRAGYARHGRGPLLTHPVAVPRPGEIAPHESHYYLELLRRLGLIPAYPEVRQIPLSATPAVPAMAREQLLLRLPPERRPLLKGKFLIGMSPGAAFGTAKRWPGERFARLALLLHRELDATSVFFGSAAEGPLIESLLPQAGRGAVSLAGRTSLADFIRLIPGCDLYVTNDTGTMHIAAALGVPTLAIFGPTDERATAPLGPRVRLLVGDAECRPCKLRHCPIDHRCMTSVTVNQVVEVARVCLQEQESDHIAWQESFLE